MSIPHSSTLKFELRSMAILHSASGKAVRFLRGFSLLVLLLCLRSHNAKANGGVFTTSSVNSTGNLQFQKKPKIDLENEVLHVELDGDWAQVEVIYTLQNRGGADKLTYGFPIDVGDAMSLNGFDKSIEAFSILDGDRSLDITKLVHEIHADPTAALTEQPYGQIVRDWFMTTLKFERRETKTLKVRYRVRSMGTTTGTSKDFIWSNSPRRFTYTFKPAKTWGSGRAHHLEVVVDVTKLQAAQIPINSIAPAGWHDENGQLRWTLENADLAKAPDLVVDYDNGKRQLHGQITAHRLDPKLIESIRTSSTHEPSSKGNYEGRNLLDGRLDTAWITGNRGTGTGEWIDVTFKRPIHLRAIGILNGYLKSSQTLAENGEAAEVEVRVYPKPAAVGDIMPSLQKSKFTEELQTMPGAFAQWVFQCGDSETVAKRFRLTIKKAKAGQKYPETAISELYIYGSEKGGRWAD